VSIAGAGFSSISPAGAIVMIDTDRVTGDLLRLSPKGRAQR